MFTRKDYLAGVVSHREYYAQFVTDATLDRLRRHFCVAEIARAYREDEHLNTIPMKTWDLLSWYSMNGGAWKLNSSGPFRVTLPFNREAVSDAGDTVTRAFLVCVAKEAARQLVSA